MKKTTYTTKNSVEKAEMLEAFSLFLEKGMDAVQRMFPKQVAFVKENKTQSYRTVKQMLFPSRIHA